MPFHHGMHSSPRSPSPLRTSFPENYARNNLRTSLDLNPFNPSTPRPGSPLSPTRPPSPLVHTHSKARASRSSFSVGHYNPAESSQTTTSARSAFGTGASSTSRFMGGSSPSFTLGGQGQLYPHSPTYATGSNKIPQGHRHTQSLQYQLPAPRRREVHEKPSQESLASTSSTTTTTDTSESATATTAATSHRSTGAASRFSSAAAHSRDHNFRLLTPSPSISSFAKKGPNTPSPRRVGVTFAAEGTPEPSPQTKPQAGTHDPGRVAPDSSGSSKRIVEISSRRAVTAGGSSGPGLHTPSPRGNTSNSHRKVHSLNLQGSTFPTSTTPTRLPTLSPTFSGPSPSTPLSLRFQRSSPSSHRRRYSSHKGSPLPSLKLEPSPIRALPTVAMNGTIIHAPRPQAYDEGQSSYVVTSSPEPSPDFQQYTQGTGESSSYFEGQARSGSRDRPTHGHSKSMTGARTGGPSLLNSPYAPNAPNASIPRPPSRSENLLRNALTRDEHALANLASMPARSRGGSLSNVLPPPPTTKRRASDADMERRAWEEQTARSHAQVQSPPRFTRTQTTPTKIQRPSSPLALQRSPRSDPSQHPQSVSPPQPTSPVLKARLERALSSSGRQRPSPTQLRSKSQDPRKRREEDRRYAQHLAEEERFEAKRALDDARERVERGYAVNGHERRSRRSTADSTGGGFPWREVEQVDVEHRVHSPYSSPSSKYVPRTPTSPRLRPAVGVASPRSTPLPLTPPPTPPATHAAPSRHSSSSDSRSSSYESLSHDRPPSSPSFKPFNVRTASQQCCQMDGYVSFASIEGLGLPPGDNEDEEDRENDRAKKGRWFGFKPIHWGWGSELP